MSDLIAKIQERILHPLPGSSAQLKMAPISRLAQMQAPEDARQSGVMILLFEENGKWHTLLMQRTEDGRVHGGQISFPGGRKEESDADIVATALRECEEEIGITSGQVTVIGVISTLYIAPSNYHVTPVIGYLSSDFQMQISEHEVQEVLKVSLPDLFDDRIKENRVITTSYGMQIESPVYVLPDGKIVWGATAMIISELEHLLKDFLYE